MLDVDCVRALAPHLTSLRCLTELCLSADDSAHFVADARVDDAGAAVLAKCLTAMTPLQRLDLRGDRITREGALALGAALSDVAGLEVVT